MAPSVATPSPVALDFTPFVHKRISRKGRISTVAARQIDKSKSVPTNLLTCLQVRTVQDGATCSTNIITTCSGCGCFDLEKFDNPRLRSLKDNNPSTVLPRRYRCRTLWQPPSSSSPSSLIMSSSPGDASSHQQSDPPIVSQSHLSLSPPRLTTSTQTPIQNQKKQPKTTRKKLATCNPDTPTSVDPLQNFNRQKLQQVCQQQQQIFKLYDELTQSQKRHLDEISFLKNDMESKNKKLRMTETQNDTLNNKIDTLKIEMQKIHERFKVMKETAKAQHDELSTLQKTLEKSKRAAYKSGFNDATAHATSTNIITLPNVLDKTTVSTLIVDCFKMVHPTKPQMHCASVVAGAVWTLFNGACQDHFTDWSTEIIRQKNPYRQGEEIAKVMDLCAGQLNITGFRELRKGLERKKQRRAHPKRQGLAL